MPGFPKTSQATSSASFPKYQYDNRLTPQENLKRAIAFHESNGGKEVIRRGLHTEGRYPMVPVYHTDRTTPVLSHYVFVTGAVMENDHLGLPWVRNPVDPPAPGWEHLTTADYQATLRNRVEYWQLRADRAEREFHQLKARATDHRRQLGAIDYKQALTRLEELQAEVTYCRDRQRKEEAAQRPQVPMRQPSQQQLAADGVRQAHLLGLRAKVMQTNLDTTPAPAVDTEEPPLTVGPAVAPGRLLHEE